MGGSKSSSLKACDSMFQNCDKTKTSIIRYDDIIDPLGQAQSKLADNVLLFVKGCGWLTSVTLPNVQSIEERRASKDSTGRRMSMEDYDRPNIRRLSLTGAKKKVHSNIIIDAWIFGRESTNPVLLNKPLI